MKKNVGGIDRTGRIVLGVLGLTAGAAIVGDVLEVGLAVGGVAVLFGLIMLFTGTTQKCPINEAAGVDTTEN
ncbi:DUF2892 domain-containing protein [Halovenus rubra]|uniref:DUF2892 domain-containing protein n=2 Tax=Halovenus rubra TaxID=869890 RepID=A0ACC7E1T8_9EURY|nr:DUF2892 domain-containing protein [Halovenus rubra]